ncbi:MAG: helix-turn-helix domain-containing protein [Bacteroidia bacterium]|jgi:transcriptional regulator with XRE-family HTH domain|nr:helix-turn-helix domain-containing protein [Bacteroidia bacterium]
MAKKPTKAKATPAASKRITTSDADKLKIIGARIRERRLALGFSSGLKFAFEHGLEPATYARHETGKNMTVVTLIKIAKALNTTASELLAGI